MKGNIFKMDLDKHWGKYKKDPLRIWNENKSWGDGNDRYFVVTGCSFNEKGYFVYSGVAYSPIPSEGESLDLPGASEEKEGVLEGQLLSGASYHEAVKRRAKKLKKL
jgi:hypothetical protein